MNGKAASSERPWSAPRRPWSLTMRWHDVLFLHWPIRAPSIRPLIPTPLELETFEGQAWIGIVPFRMRGVRPRWLPALPGISAFPELNLRTYVRFGSKSGVWFFSLDAASRFAVRVARATFHLPYYDALMQVERRGDEIDYQSMRVHAGAPAAVFSARYAPKGEVFRAETGSLDEWLTARYCLYTVDPRGRLWRGEIDHSIWPLQQADVEINSNSIAIAAGFSLPDMEPLAHFSQALGVVAWSLDRIV